MLSKANKFVLNHIANNANACQYATQVKMPECDGFKPEKYKGLSFEDALKIRKTNFSKGLFAYYKEPIMIHQGHKQWLFDVNNKRYLDLFAGIVTVSVGHCHPKVNAALQEQMQKLWHTTTIYLYPVDRKLMILQCIWHGFILEGLIFYR